MIDFSLLVVICLLAVSVIVFGSTAAKNKTEYPDIFSHEDVYITAGQHVDRLLVANGNAEVAGKVTEGIMIADGNLTLQPGADVKGLVVVIGGHAEVKQGARLEERVWVIPPQGYRMVPFVVGTLFVIGAISLILLPILIWVSAYFFKRTPWYLPFQKCIQEVQRRWPALYIFASLTLSGFMLIAFTAMAWETIFRNAMGFFDNAIIWLVRYFTSPVIDKVMIFISDLGYGLRYTVIISAVFLLLAYFRRWREVAGLAVCLAGGAALNYLLKHLFQRSRPELFRVVQESGYSFPSGHAMVSLCFYGMLAFLIMRLIPSWRKRLTVMTLAVILVVAIGISRIYLGVHYPSDVVAGYAAGSMWLAFCISLLMWWERERKQKRN